MPCNAEHPKIRQIYVGGCFKYAPYLLLMELNNSEEWEAWITLKEEVALVIISHGQKQIGIRDDESPIIAWCKKTLFAIKDNDEQEKTEWVKTSLENPDSIPANWDDWRESPYNWELPKPTAEETNKDNFVCELKHESNIYANYLEGRLITTNENEVKLSLETNSEVEAKLEIAKKIAENCILEEPTNLTVNIFGFNFSPRQLETAKIIGASGWVKI